MFLDPLINVLLINSPSSLFIIVNTNDLVSLKKVIMQSTIETLQKVSTCGEYSATINDIKIVYTAFYRLVKSKLQANSISQRSLFSAKYAYVYFAENNNPLCIILCM